MSVSSVLVHTSCTTRRMMLLLLLFVLTPQSSHALTSPVDPQYLERKVEELFVNAKQMPLVLSRAYKGNNGDDKPTTIHVRTSFDGDTMVSVAEACHPDHDPDEFVEFLENFGAAFPQVNPMARNVQHLEGDAQSCQGVKSVLEFPFPLRNRIMLHWKYLRLHRGCSSPKQQKQQQQHEHMLILSEQGNQELLQKHYTPSEQKDYVLARTFLCVYWIKPLRCPQTGNIRGSSIQYAFSGDTGGNIPAWVQNQVGPKTALDSVQGLLDYVGRNQNKKQAASAGNKDH
ncbi:expressed unknown protein [Seminavis robusta]|uniref:Uncharacterized protein n=1 Tax=Seminavis robusta TaxID=568900 RepID=A0A9N8HV75_9STRA|nr:expressed unknown protein [Seminavis robusta]|eukprot:Sro1756_g295650.1 n/a (286) ;mRNA; f:17438-18295